MASELKVEFQVIESSGRRGDIKLLTDISGKTSFKDLLDFEKRAKISIAREVLREEQRNGFDKNPRTRVDNKFDVPIETVKPFGKIEYFSRQDVGAALIEIFEGIESRSPVSTGKYRKSNVMIFNGIPVANSVSEAKLWLKGIRTTRGFKDSDEIRFINTSPYARKLEFLGVRRGTTGKKKGTNYSAGARKRKSRRLTKTLRQPNGTYYLVSRLIKRKFKSLGSFISFTFMPNGTNGLRVDSLAGERTTFAATRKNIKAGKAGRPYLYPSILIRLSGAGITGEVAYE